jgi:hypothetical protein
MDVLSTIFSGMSAVIIGIILGLIIAAIIGVTALVIIKIRDRNKDQ